MRIGQTIHYRFLHVHALALVLFPGVLRNRVLLYNPPQRLNTDLLLILLLSFHGYVFFLEISGYFYAPSLFFGVIIFLQFQEPLILCFMLEPNMLRWITTLCKRRFFKNLRRFGMLIHSFGWMASSQKELHPRCFQYTRSKFLFANCPIRLKGGINPDSQHYL